MSRVEPRPGALGAPGLVRRRGDVAAVVAAAAVLVITSLAAARDLGAWERSLFRTLNGENGIVAGVLWVPMQLGVVALVPVFAAATFAVLRRWRPALGVACAGVAAWLLARALKHAVDRPRPRVLVADTVLHAGAGGHGLGFPSGHTAIAFALATVVAPYASPRWRVALFALAAVVGFARIYTGAHFPLDALGGAALGVILGSLWNVAVKVPARPEVP